MAKKIKTDYDGLLVLGAPINILDDHGSIISIYALLYNRDKHRDDLFMWELNRYISYLLGCVEVQNKGCKIAPELWIMEDGNMIPLNVGAKNVIYRVMKNRIDPYLIVEYEEPLEFYEDEIEDMWVISPAPIIRRGILIKGKEVKDEK